MLRRNDHAAARLESLQTMETIIMRKLAALTAIVLSAYSLSPAWAEQVPGSKTIMPSGGMTVQEGVQTEPTACPDGSKPNAPDTAASDKPTETSITVAPPAQDAENDNQELCPPSGESTTNSGVNADDTPAAVEAPSMK